LVLSLLAWIAAAEGAPSEQSADASTIVDYTSADDVFANPERGFLYSREVYSWGETIPPGRTLIVGHPTLEELEATFLAYRETDSVTLVRLYFYLDDFVPNYYDLPGDLPDSYPEYEGTPSPIEISSAYLELVEANLQALRASGLKAILRFAYTNKRFEPPFEDADLDQVIAHLDQLQGPLRDHSDVIALLEAGFIGNWGEWFYTDHFAADPYSLADVTAGDYANRGAVVSKILQVLPARMVQLRTPHYKYQILDPPDPLPVPYAPPRSGLPTPVGAPDAHGGGAVARTGHHNDCFLGNATDAGTYGLWLSIADDQSYVAQETRYVPMGGEVCDPGGDQTRFGCADALAELARFHWSYLNVETGSGSQGVYDGWSVEAEPCLAQIKRKLGYRFTLVQGTYTDQTEPGEPFTVHIVVHNDGWAAPYNARPVKLVLRHTGTGDTHTVALDEDPRFWMPGDTQVLDHAIQADVPAGSYELLLYLPDADPSLAERPEYAIRLANEGIWEEDTGYNSLGHTLDVQSQPATSFTVPLSEGWNLVSLGEASADEPIAALMAPIMASLVKVIGFETTAINPNPPIGGKLYDPLLGEHINTLDQTDSRLAYWLMMGQPDVLITGGVPAKTVSLPKVESGGLHPVCDFMGIHGTLRIDGAPAPVGTLVEVIDAQGTLAGRFRVHHPGYYGFLPIYRDDAGTTVDEGADTNEWLTVLVDGQAASERVRWTSFGEVTELHLEVASLPRSPLPAESALGPNYPNPFNTGTAISYQLARDGRTVLSIWSLTGQLVRELVHSPQPAGHYSVTWNGLNDGGIPVASGVYFCELRTPSFRALRKMLLVR